MPKAKALPNQAMVVPAEGCCPLCDTPLPLKDILYTTDFDIFVRRGKIAQFTPGEASVMRALFGAQKTGFRLAKETLIGRIYSGSEAPLTADVVLRTHLTDMRHKLCALGMGVVFRNNLVTLVFVDPRKHNVPRSTT